MYVCVLCYRSLKIYLYIITLFLPLFLLMGFFFSIFIVSFSPESSSGARRSRCASPKYSSFISSLNVMEERNKKISNKRTCERVKIAVDSLWHVRRWLCECEGMCMQCACVCLRVHVVSNHIAIFIWALSWHAWVCMRVFVIFDILYRMRSFRFSIILRSCSCMIFCSRLYSRFNYRKKEKKRKGNEISSCNFLNYGDKSVVETQC